MVKCAKLGRELPGLDEPPFDTELGQKIYENVSAEAWKMWAEHSKMLLNEYRLQPWKPEAQEFIVEQMNAYFFGEGDVYFSATSQSDIMVTGLHVWPDGSYVGGLYYIPTGQVYAFAGTGAYFEIKP